MCIKCIGKATEDLERQYEAVLRTTKDKSPLMKASNELTYRVQREMLSHLLEHYDTAYKGADVGALMANWATLASSSLINMLVSLKDFSHCPHLLRILMIKAGMDELTSSLIKGLGEMQRRDALHEQKKARD